MIKDDGDEVVQLYAKDRITKLKLPIRFLAGFKRERIKSGESEVLQITLKSEQLRYFDERTNKFVVDPGIYEIQVGASSEDIRLKRDLVVK